MEQQYCTDGFRHFQEVYPNGPECELSKIWFESAQKQQSAFQAVMQHCDGNLEGIELKHSNREAWAVILPEMSDPQCGSHRAQYFDESGFSGHHVCRTAAKVLEDLISEGYRLLDAGRLDQLAATSAWQLGTAKVDLLRRLNCQLITHQQFLEAVTELSRKAA